MLVFALLIRISVAAITRPLSVRKIDEEHHNRCSDFTFHSIHTLQFFFVMSISSNHKEYLPVSGFFLLNGKLEFDMKSCCGNPDEN